MRQLDIPLLLSLMLMVARAGEGQEILRPAPGSPLRIGPGSGELFLGDLDRDGDLDLVSKHLLERRIAVHRGLGNGTFEPNHQSLTLDAGAIALADADGDGLLDLAVASRDSSWEYMQFVRGTADGFADPSRTSRTRTHAAAATWKPIVRFVDVDRDGKLDIVTGNGRRASIEILLGNGRGEFALRPSVRLETDGDRHEFDLGDVDGNGTIDLVDAGGIETGGRGYLRVYSGDGRGEFAPIRGAPIGGPPAPRGTALADMDRDGDLDVLLAHADSHASVLLNDGAGRFTPAGGSPFRLPGPAFSLAAADLNADGRPDLVAATVTSVSVLLGREGGLSPAPGSPYPAGPGAYRLTVGDIDANGRPDVIASSFEGSTLRVLLGGPAR
jgi:hypothetical protein